MNLHVRLHFITQKYREIESQLIQAKKEKQKDKIDKLSHEKWKFSKEIKTLVEQYVYDNLSQLTYDDVNSIKTLLPKSIYSQLQEKIKLILNQVEMKG